MPSDEKSRSQIKREFRALKELGRQLVALSAGQLRTIPLSDETRAAVQAAKNMARNALQRQYRYLSSLVADEDVDAIRAALSGAQQPHAEAVAALHRAEQWRDALIAGDEGRIAEFVERFPECDRTHVRRLVRNAKKEEAVDRPPKSSRQLFRYLKQLLDEPASPDSEL